MGSEIMINYFMIFTFLNYKSLYFVLVIVLNMVLNVFTDGASRGNPGKAGIGIVIYEGKQMAEVISDFVGIRTNNEAEYLALIRAVERILDMKKNEKVNFFADSEFLVKQIKGEYKVKSERIKPLYEKAKKLLEKLGDFTFNWVGRSDNAEADELANKALDNVKGKASRDKEMRSGEKIEKKEEVGGLKKLKLNKSFFGKTSCFKVQMNSDNEIYFHMGVLENNKWVWDKVKMSDMEVGEIVNILLKESGKCSFYHSFNGGKTQIWCNKSHDDFSIKINNKSKKLNLGESQVLRVILEKAIEIGNF